jgi:hypothetical protein
MPCKKSFADELSAIEQVSNNPSIIIIAGPAL